MAGILGGGGLRGPRRPRHHPDRPHPARSSSVDERVRHPPDASGRRAVRRARQLHRAAHQRRLLGRHRARPVLHGRLDRSRARIRHGPGPVDGPAAALALVAANPGHPALGAANHRQRADVEVDRQRRVRGAQRAADTDRCAPRLPAVAVGQRPGDVDGHHRRRLEADPLGRDPAAGRPAVDRPRGGRGGPRRWRRTLAGLPAHPAAARDAGHPHPPRAAHDGGIQGLRPHLDHDPWRAGQLDADDRHLRLPDRLPGI